MDRVAAESLESMGEYATLFCVQPWLDFDSVSSSLVVTEFGSRSSVAQSMCDTGMQLWSIRREFNVDWVSPADLIGRVRDTAARPILISEATDAPTARGSGDHTGLMACLLPFTEALKSCIYLVDPQFAKRAELAGVGAAIERELGASIDARYSQPRYVHARVEHISDGRFTARGPAFHGCNFSMGLTTVLSIQGLRIITASKPVMMIDREPYRSQGVDPATQDVVGIKSPLLFRAAYQFISDTVIHLDSSGPCRGRLDKVEFSKISRPIYPVDDFEWSPPKLERIDLL